MEKQKKPSAEERYRYVHEYVTLTGEVEVLTEPIKLDLMPERIGKPENLDSSSLFYKLYKGRFDLLANACSKDGDCLILIGFVLHCLENGKYQTVSLSKENLADIMGWSRPKLYKVLNILEGDGLLCVKKIYKNFHFFVNPDAIWQWSDDLKWRTRQALEGKFKYVNSMVIFKDTDVEMHKNRILEIKGLNNGDKEN